MTKCPNIERCLFFNNALENMPATAQYYKNQYCTGEHQQCARFMVSEQLGRLFVPADLFPKDVKRAKEILSTSQNNPIQD